MKRTLLSLSIAVSLGTITSQELNAQIFNVPTPLVVDNASILKNYKDDFDKKLLASGQTKSDVDELLRKILYSPKINSREGIERFSNWVESMPDALGEDPFPLYHKFGGGVYTREMHTPAGYTIVGKIHKKESMVYVVKGKLIVSDENQTRVIEAPAQFTCGGKLKRVAYVLEDLIWIDIHATDAINVEDAENEIFAKNYEELEMNNDAEVLLLEDS